MTDTPLCTDCKHFKRVYRLSPSYGCNRPLTNQRSPVNGALLDTVNGYADNERRPSRKWFGFGRERCGPEGKFWEAKP